jgi:hypothetical protein
VTLCGVQVWTDRAYPEMGQVLRWLAERTPHGYVRLRGTELCRRLDRDASNPLGQPVKRFRETCREKMATCLHLDCGLYDVIGPTQGGGYHLTDAIEARILEAETEAAIPPGSDPAPLLPGSQGPALNPRQRWILDQIDLGSELRQKTLIEHFRREVNPSTVKRDLKELRDRKLILTGPNGHYTRLEGGH